MRRLKKYLCLTILMFVSVAVMAQESKVTVMGNNITVKQAFEQIEAQSKFSIACNITLFNAERKITINMKNKPLKEVLTTILKRSGFTYKMNENHIIIIPETETPKPAKGTKIEKTTQTVRGIVRDANSGEPLPYINVLISNTTNGAITDSLGNFRISNVPIGRYDLLISSVGYEPLIICEQLLTSAKEGYNEILLQEKVLSLGEVIVTPTVNNQQPINTMAITGGRMISMEESKRFANGFDDPARLATAFAGVAGEVGTNAIAIRGNSPQYTKWKLEGIEIPNPSHFSDFTTVGGGFLSALNTNIITNSDFYNGAFPSEYDNSLSGVFDMRMRIGNNQKYEHSFQVGLMGMEFASEGPISKSIGSSYIFNIRASNTSLVTSGETNLSYQDLTFKLNFPTKNCGVFSIWGLGILDRNKVSAEKDSTKWETMMDRRNSKDNLEKLMGGLSHKYIINSSTSINSSLAATYSSDHLLADQIGSDSKLIRVGDVINKNWNFSLSSYINKRFNSRHVNRTGIRFTNLNYDLDYKISPSFGLDVPAEQVSKGNGSTATWSAYTTSLFTFNKYLSATIGLNMNNFLLTKEWSLEPRTALKWSPNGFHSLAIAYGLHTQKEKLNYYFVERKINDKIYTNQDLKLSKAHHVNFSYNWRISTDMVLKIEPYYQYLFNIPVEDKSTFSIINHQEYYLDRLLKNNGTGKNYGIDITLERYMKDGFYYMLSGSIFKSKYKGGDDVWRSTKYDRGYIFNIVTGKEWQIGKNNQNTFGVNARLFSHGGDHYTPVDENKSHDEKEIVLDEAKAYSEQYKPVVNGDISLNLRINKKKSSHEFSFKVLNIGMDTGMYFYEYHENNLKIKNKKGIGIVPNFSYKISF